MNVTENQYGKSIIEKQISNSPTEQVISSWLKFIDFVEIFSCFIWWYYGASNMPGKYSMPLLYPSLVGKVLVWVLVTSFLPVFTLQEVYYSIQKTHLWGQAAILTESTSVKSINY